MPQAVRLPASMLAVWWDRIISPTAVVRCSYYTGSAAGNNMTGGLVGFNAGYMTVSYVPQVA